MTSGRNVNNVRAQGAGQKSKTNSCVDKENSSGRAALRGETSCLGAVSSEKDVFLTPVDISKQFLHLIL